MGTMLGPQRGQGKVWLNQPFRRRAFMVTSLALVYVLFWQLLVALGAQSQRWGRRLWRGGGCESISRHTAANKLGWNSSSSASGWELLEWSFKELQRLCVLSLDYWSSEIFGALEFCLPHFPAACLGQISLPLPAEVSSSAKLQEVIEVEKVIKWVDA